MFFIFVPLLQEPKFMYVFYILSFLAIIAIILGIIEFRRHQDRIYSIPYRIHINGTRGKSSVTRLVGAALRENGVSTITKVTGTFPRLILEDGTETYIHRRSAANIIEQLSIVKFAASRKVEALVMECMALQPLYQSITEDKMIHANVGVMTNIRLDHVDVMGYTLPEIAETLGRTVPKGAHLFSAEDVIPHTLKAIADKRNTESHFTDKESVTKEEMKGFSYIEHKENVALALAVCEHLKVDRETAFRGMYKAIPDEGALKCFTVDAFNKQLNFYDAFAAYDPDSTHMIWKIIRDDIGFRGTRIVLLNTRHDRLDRAKQLAEMVSNRLDEEVDYLILMGQSTDVVQGMTTGYGFPKNKIINIGWTTPEKVFEKVLSITKTASTIIAIGNMGGAGAETAEYFEHRSQ